MASRIFSPLDEIMPPLHNALIFGFPCDESKKGRTFSVLQKALSKTIAERPFLAGEIVREGSDEPSNGFRPGHLTLKVPDPLGETELALNDLTLPGRDSGHTYEELRAAGMPCSKLDGSVLAPLVGIGKTNKVIAAQINFIHGGCLLSMCFSHTFVDAYGAYLIMAMWAQNCRELQDLSTPPFPTANAQEEDDLKPPALHRKIHFSEYDGLRQRSELWRLLGLDWRVSWRDRLATAPYLTNGVVDASTFSITPEDLAQLKKESAPRASDIMAGGPTWVSTNDALVAFLWLVITRARFPPNSSYDIKPVKESMVSVAIEGRNGLSPSISMSYIGNVVFCCTTVLPISMLTSPDTTLASIALSIRRSIERDKDPQRLQDAISLASCIPDVRAFSNAFPSWFAEDLVTTSWVDLPFYNLEWGSILGETRRIEFFKMPKGQFDGICSIQPRQRDRIIDVIIELEEKQMKHLRDDKLFREYVKFVSH